MAKRESNQAIAKADESNVLSAAIPAWMATERSEQGIDDAQRSRTTARLKIIQSNAKREIKEVYGPEGSVGVSPAGIPVAGPEEPFDAIPLLNFLTWERWSDINDNATPMVEEVSYDSGSEIARRSRSRQHREEPYGPANNPTLYKRKFVEVINYILLIDSGPAKGQMVLASFSIGEWFQGRRLNDEVARRAEMRSIPLYGNRFQFATAHRDRNNRQWIGLDFNNAAEPLVTDQALFEKLKGIHLSLAKNLKEQKFTIVRDSDGDAGMAAGDDGTHPDV